MKTKGIAILHNPIKRIWLPVLSKASIFNFFNLHKINKGMLAKITLTKARVRDHRSKLQF